MPCLRRTSCIWVRVLDINRRKTSLKGFLDMEAALSVITIELWTRVGFDTEDLIDCRIKLSAANTGALRVLGRTLIMALNVGERNLWINRLVVENLDEPDQLIWAEISSQVLL